MNKRKQKKKKSRKKKKELTAFTVTIRRNCVSTRVCNQLTSRVRPGGLGGGNNIIEQIVGPRARSNNYLVYML